MSGGLWKAREGVAQTFIEPQTENRRRGAPRWKRARRVPGTTRRSLSTAWGEGRVAGKKVQEAAEKILYSGTSCISVARDSRRNLLRVK